MDALWGYGQAHSLREPSFEDTWGHALRWEDECASIHVRGHALRAAATQSSMTSRLVDGISIHPTRSDPTPPTTRNVRL